MIQKRQKQTQNYLQRLSDFLEPKESPKLPSYNSWLSIVANAVEKLIAKQNCQSFSEQRDDSNESLSKVSYYIDLALQTFKNIREPLLDDSNQANFLFALSETYESLGDYPSALKNYATVLELAEKAKDQSLQGKIKYRMASILSELGHWQRAKELLQESMLALKTIDNYHETAYAQIELAKISYRRGEYLAAMEAFKAARTISDAIGETRSRAIINNHLGIILRMKGEYDLAYQHIQESLVGFQSVQDYRGTAECLNNLGVVHFKRQQPQMAISYFEKAHQLCQATGHFPLLAFVYLNKTEYYCQATDYLMALNVCCRALENFVRLNNPIGLAKTNLLFGRIFKQAGQFERAEKFYQESLKLYQDFKIPLGLANGHREFSQMLKECGKSQEALIHESEAQKILAKLHMEKTETKKAVNREPDLISRVVPD
ncbi:MAG: tetratricopeptide repeat protein [bacterium]